MHLITTHTVRLTSAAHTALTRTIATYGMHTARHSRDPTLRVHISEAHEQYAVRIELQSAQHSVQAFVRAADMHTGIHKAFHRIEAQVHPLLCTHQHCSP